MCSSGGIWVGATSGLLMTFWLIQVKTTSTIIKNLCAKRFLGGWSILYGELETREPHRIVSSVMEYGRVQFWVYWWNFGSFGSKQIFVEGRSILCSELETRESLKIKCNITTICDELQTLSYFWASSRTKGSISSWLEWCSIPLKFARLQLWINFSSNSLVCIV